MGLKCKFFIDMEKLYYLYILLSASLLLHGCNQSKKNLFWGDGTQFFEVRQIFDNERLPNVITAKDGTVIAVWGWNNVRVRRSEDGGKTWGPEISVGPGLNSGGAMVDETNGDFLVFTEDTHPPAPLHMFRSKDHGKTWVEEEINIHPDSKGNVPSMYMNERGMTLQRGKYAGRLIRPSRVYTEGNGTAKFFNKPFLIILK
jgi:sialidase-1